MSIMQRKVEGLYEERKNEKSSTEHFHALGEVIHFHNASAKCGRFKHN